MKIKEIKIENKSIILLDDSDNIGGTKDRAMGKFLKSVIKKNQTTRIFFPASPNGLGMVSASLAANKLRNKGYDIEMNIYTQYYDNASSVLFSKELGSNVKVYDKPFREIYQILEDECKSVNGIEISLGGSNKVFKKIMESNIKKLSLPIINSSDSHIWLVHGSGTIYNTMCKVFDKCIFHVVVVGKNPPQKSIRKQDFVYKSKYKFYESTRDPPPYKTELTYDGKLWEILKKNITEGNIYIWNVGYLPKYRYERFSKCEPF